MSIKNLLKSKKRGGASMFIVVFTIIILSIVTLSFTRLIISEATKTTNDDLSQSAYDSAMAGVEDAKVALLKYHQCLDRGAKANASGSECDKIVYEMQEGIRTADCSTVQKVLGREATAKTENGVVIQETQNSSDNGNNTDMLQKYTCVTIDEELPDYRTTLNSSNRTRIIPIRSEDLNSLGQVELKWFSETNLSRYSSENHASTSFCADAFYPNGQCNGKSQVPTTLAVRLIQTDDEFNLSELSVSKKADQTDTGQLILVPTNGGGNNNIEAGAWGESANKGPNDSYKVQCAQSGAWLCDVNITLPKPFRGGNRNAANTYLVISLPYGSPETDISLTNKLKNGQVANFTGIQARVDSTGRANDLYRRVETRIELVDTYYPYPEFEITMTGGNDSALEKDFWVTFNCMTADDGKYSECDNRAD